MSDAGGGAPPPAGGKKQLDLAETVKKLKRLVTLYKKEVDRLKEKESALLVELEEQKEQLKDLDEKLDEIQRLLRETLAE